MEETVEQMLEAMNSCWTCPVCLEKGIFSKVCNYQASNNRALFFCEQEGCIYPIRNEYNSVIIRTPLEIPASEELIETAGLPQSLREEDHVQLQHVFYLHWIKSFLQYLPSAIQSANDFKFLVKLLRDANMLYSDETISFGDPDLNTLLNLPEYALKLARHLDPNIDHWLEEARKSITPL